MRRYPIYPKQKLIFFKLKMIIGSHFVHLGTRRLCLFRHVNTNEMYNIQW